MWPYNRIKIEPIKQVLLKFFYVDMVGSTTSILADVNLM